MRTVKVAIVSGVKIFADPRVPPSRYICAKRARSSAVLKRPAWPDTPPIAKAFSSCTSPCTCFWRHGSNSVGAIRGRSAAGGLYMVAVMPSGANTFRSR